VTRVDAPPAAAVVAQIQTVVQDIAVQAVKTGMLLNQEIITAVAEQVEALRIDNLVVDPVMVSRTGAQLIDDGSSPPGHPHSSGRCGNAQPLRSPAIEWFRNSYTG